MRLVLCVVMLVVCLVGWECTADELGGVHLNSPPSSPPPPPPSVSPSSLQGSSSPSDPSRPAEGLIASDNASAAPSVPAAGEAHSRQDDRGSSSSTRSSSTSSTSTSSSVSTALSSSGGSEGASAITTSTEAVTQSVDNRNPTDGTGHKDTGKAPQRLLEASSHTSSGSEPATKDSALTLPQATEGSGQDAPRPTPTSTTTEENAGGAQNNPNRNGEEDSRTQTLNAQGQRNAPTEGKPPVTGTHSTPNMQSPPGLGTPTITQDHPVERDTTLLNPTPSTAQSSTNPSRTSSASTTQGTGISTNGPPPTVEVIKPPAQHLNQNKPEATSTGKRQVKASEEAQGNSLTNQVGKKATTPTNAAIQRKVKAPTHKTPTTTTEGEVNVPGSEPSANKTKASSKDVATTTNTAVNAERNQAAATTGEKDVNTGQTSVPSMTEHAKTESTAAAKKLPKLPKTMEQIDLRDGSTGSLSLSGFTALVTLAVMAAAPVFKDFC